MSLPEALDTAKLALVAPNVSLRKRRGKDFHRKGRNGRKGDKELEISRDLFGFRLYVSKMIPLFSPIFPLRPSRPLR